MSVRANFVKRKWSKPVISWLTPSSRKGLLHCRLQPRDCHICWCCQCRKKLSWLQILLTRVSEYLLSISDYTKMLLDLITYVLILLLSCPVIFAIFILNIWSVDEQCIILDTKVYNLPVTYCVVCVPFV